MHFWAASLDRRSKSNSWKKCLEPNPPSPRIEESRKSGRSQMVFSPAKYVSFQALIPHPTGARRNRRKFCCVTCKPTTRACLGGCMHIWAAFGTSGEQQIHSTCSIPVYMIEVLFLQSLSKFINTIADKALCMAHKSAGRFFKSLAMTGQASALFSH